MALKRKRGSSESLYGFHQSTTTPISSINVVESYLPFSDGEENERRKKKRTENFEKPLSLHFGDCRGSSDQATASPKNKRRSEGETNQTSIITGLKRKRSSLSDQVYDSHQSTPSSTNASENHQPIGASEELEEPVRKKRRSKGFEKLLSLKSIRYGSDQAIIQEKQIKDHISLRSVAWYRPLSSEDLPSVDQQVQSPLVSVQHSPASAHSSIVDLTTEEDILSRYEVGKMLGEGGFGCVYEGKRLEDGLEVAVKIARKPRNMKYIDVPGHPSPVPLEVGLLLLVNKEPSAPEIIQLLDWEDQPERYIMVMERPSPCKDLRKYMMFQEGFLSEDKARSIMAQAIKAAHTCCQRGVFHRDIKLQNLLINPETLEVKLIDFGCGDLLRDSSYRRFCGTKKYFPPEYYVDRKYYGKPATVWSLGVLLFVLVCGRYPEPRDRELIDYGIWLEPDLSSECCNLIRCLLKGNPSRRIDLGEILLHDWFKITRPTWRRKL